VGNNNYSYKHSRCEIIARLILAEGRRNIAFKSQANLNNYSIQDKSNLIIYLTVSMFKEFLYDLNSDLSSPSFPSILQFFILPAGSNYNSIHILSSLSNNSSPAHYSFYSSMRANWNNLYNRNISCVSRIDLPHSNPHNNLNSHIQLLSKINEELVNVVNSSLFDQHNPSNLSGRCLGNISYNLQADQQQKFFLTLINSIIAANSSNTTTDNQCALCNKAYDSANNSAAASTAQNDQTKLNSSTAHSSALAANLVPAMSRRTARVTLSRPSSAVDEVVYSIKVNNNKAQNKQRSPATRPQSAAVANRIIKAKQSNSNSIPAFLDDPIHTAVSNEYRNKLDLLQQLLCDEMFPPAISNKEKKKEVEDSHELNDTDSEDEYIIQRIV
jgi:hypothetical protein